MVTHNIIKYQNSTVTKAATKSQGYKFLNITGGQIQNPKTSHTNAYKENNVIGIFNRSELKETQSSIYRIIK